MHKIYIDGIPVDIDLTGSNLEFGSKRILAEQNNDTLKTQEWYPDGYTIHSILMPQEFNDLKSSIAKKIGDIFSQLSIKLPDEQILENYHIYIDNSNLIHEKIINFTRNLTFEDFDFNFEIIQKRISKLLKLPLSKNNHLLNTSYVIVRINRPESNDYNPPHRDAYLDLWENSINVWIPISGVGQSSTLPIAPRSHLISEDLVQRTVGESIVNGRRYHVPAITSWGGENQLIRPTVNYGEALIFTPYLIHGVAKNMQKNATRIALELRLSLGDGCR
jgi:ectoine hydroxylase-related dioxygenase (phytanoyl-CoA dioxygenase family)